MTDRELRLRHEIFRSFAATGAPPAVVDDREALGELERRHVVVLRDGHIYMAHPFAGHRDGTRVESGGVVWWGNCAWDGLGIVAALGVSDARLVDRDGVTVGIAGGRVVDDALFQIAVPAARWWDDIEFT